MFGSSTGTTGSTLGRSASFSFSQQPTTKPFSGTPGGFSFGNTANTATTSQPGASTSTAAPATGGGFSFGAKPAGTTTGGGGLFGSTPATQPQQQQQQQPGLGGGLFGASHNTAGTSTGGFGGGFGAAKPAGGLFGAPASTSTGGLFGQPQQQSQQQQQQQQQQQPQQSSFGGFGSFQQQPQQQQHQQQQQQQHQQQQQFQSPFFRFGYYQKERFNDLPEDAKKLLEELDRHVSAQIQVRDELRTKDFGGEIRKCAAEWQELDSALKSLSATLESDLNQARDVVERLEKDRADNVTLWSIGTNAKEGRSDGSAFVDWLQKYFVNLADEYRDRIARYRNTIETIERHLQSLESRETYTPQAISDVIHAQHASFMALAAQVAALHSDIDGLKKDYAAWYKQTHKSVRDPFGSMNLLASSVAPS
ncbi:hypothetical protein BCV70DRAFT_154914 [Testicularia cyperi]|uniref:Nucleoporin NSP1-like C-terminal domain-containing protein n=1 Tax=Testicularia cyperi TaxID=1882483 RepID=A0A317XYQ1_9BASI|nr:hypothetical protein BCV70DRAFT_154914 [Testicularia cyperi]